METKDCSREKDQVCGTDGNTYLNDCILKAESCARNDTVGVKHRGACGKVDKLMTDTFLWFHLSDVFQRLRGNCLTNAKSKRMVNEKVCVLKLRLKPYNVMFSPKAVRRSWRTVKVGVLF